MLQKVVAATAFVVGVGVLVVPTAANAVPFKNCSAARAAGYENIPSTSEYYGEHLHRDLDGIGCESTN